jgi:hypothetical protein
MTQFSLAQTKLIAKIEAGACVKFDSTTGGYVLVENGVQRKVHLRTITALLSVGRMYQTLLGYCVLAPSSDTAADTMAA